MGDYRAGLRGDPGFWSIIKGAASSAVGMIPGVGGIGSKIMSASPSGVRRGGMAVGSAIIKHPVLSGAGAAAVVALGGAEAGKMGILGRRAGKHPSARHLRALAMGLRRARPRMNVTNVHALRRSLRRAHGFARLAMKAIHLLHPKKKARLARFHQLTTQRCPR